MNPSIHLMCRVVFAITLWSMAFSATVMADSKDQQLRQTMAQIALLNGQMAQRKADAAGIREALSAQLKTLASEARQEMHQHRIKNEAEARQHARLFYDLRLMAEIRAYIGRYTQKIGYYRVACDRLSYLYQQADDDLKIINTLSGMKIEALIEQANRVLDDYLADAQTIQIQPSQLAVASSKKTWATLKGDR